jgi:N-acetyl-alpha-D-muramate 1-phosphate uridylyltransferase
VDVLILAAGRGERMRPLTDHTPKPLLEVGGTTLIERQVSRLASAGHRRIVVNLAHLGEQIAEKLDDGSRYGAHITYSPEPPGALDTGGGIVQALGLLRGDCFAVVNADIWTDFPYQAMPTEPRAAAWLVLVDNPPHNPRGDFELAGETVRACGRASRKGLTFAGIGVYRRSLFTGRPEGSYPLLPILLEAISRGDVDGILYRGLWTDVGTPERLETLRAAADRS